MARSLTPNEVLNGGVINGQPMDPVSYILYGLEVRFAQLADEARLAAMNELTAFQRRPHESINAVLARYQLVRQRANTDGGFVMSVEICALKLVRALHVISNQLLHFLEPYGGVFPTTEQQFEHLCSRLRRHGHIVEHSPNNIASSLSGPRHARPGYYMVTTSQ